MRAQNARVVTGDFSNGQILDVTFDPPGSTQLNNDAANLGGLVSVVFRDDGADGLHLIAADRLRGQVLLYTDGVGTGAVVLHREVQTHPLFPAGLSLDVHDNLYGTSSSVQSEGRSAARVWVIRRDPSCASGCLPGGYAPNVGTIDGTIVISVPIGGNPTAVRVVLLEDTRVVPSGGGALGAGDLLVLASSPAAVLRYPRAAVEAFLGVLAQGGTPAELEPEIFVYPDNASVDPARRFPAGAVPSGMEFTPQGNLLVGTSGGNILVYRPDGTRLSNGGGFVDFATGLGSGKLKIATGPQDALFRAFVSDSANGAVLRFLIEPDGTGTLDGVADDAAFPLGISTTTASVVPTPPGANVTVELTNLMQSTIENVESPGETSASVVLFEDPRELEVSIPPDQPLHRSLRLSEIRADLPPDAEIPAYVRAFRKDDRVLGPPTFVLILVDTNIQPTGVIDHVIDEQLILGYEPDCADADSTAQQRLFWLPSPAEPPSLESPTFVDVSNDCGTSRGMTRSFSMFLASARDTRTSRDIAKTKLLALRTVLERAPCVDPPLAAELREKLDLALVLFQHYRYEPAIAQLNAFTALIQGAPEAFASCAINEGGEMRARADSAIFILEKLPFRILPDAHW